MKEREEEKLYWSRLIRKAPDARKDWRQEGKGMTEDEMFGWHHWLDQHESEQALKTVRDRTGVLQSMGLQRVGHNWVTKQQSFTGMFHYCPASLCSLPVSYSLLPWLLLPAIYLYPRPFSGDLHCNFLRTIKSFNTICPTKGTIFYSYCSPVFPIFANNTTNWLQEVTDFSNTGHLSYPNNFQSVNCQPMSFCLFHSLSYYCYYPFQVSVRFPLSYVLLQLLNWSPASNLSLFRSNCDSRTESISPLYKWHHKVSLMSGVLTQLCPTLCDPSYCSLSGSSVHGTFSGKNTGVGCLFLLQGNFPTKGLTQGSNPPLLHLCHWQGDSLPLSHLGSSWWVWCL